MFKNMTVVDAKSREKVQMECFSLTSRVNSAPVRTMTGTPTPGTSPNTSPVAIIFIDAEFVIQ